MATKPTGMPRTDALVHKLSEAHYAETAMERQGRVEWALVQMCAQLEKEIIAALKEIACGL